MPLPYGRHCASALVALLATGCYSVGFEPAAGLSEIAVPVFENHTLRRELEHDLTRHVRREILEGTPLQLARAGEGVAVLRGAVSGVQETVLVAGDAEEVLASSVMIAAAFGVYEDGRLVIGEDADGDGAPETQIVVQGYAEFNAGRGETRADATDEALRDLAELIVYRLEARVDDRLEPNDDAEHASLLVSGRQVALLQRNDDWFKVEVPARHALRATIYFDDDDDLALDASAGEPQGKSGERVALAGLSADRVERSDEGRILRVLGGEAKQSVFLKVSGSDLGKPYQLLVEIEPDDGSEPDTVPEQAVQLPGGQKQWRVRRIQRDDDYVAVAVPSGHGLRAKLLAPAPGLELTAVDDLGAQRMDGKHSSDRGSLTLPADPKSRRVLLRVSGDGEGRVYTLDVELVEGL